MVLEGEENTVICRCMIVQIASPRLIRLLIVLVWLSVMYDKLLTNPFLAILLVLGVLTILFGGTIRFGPIRIEGEDRAPKKIDRSSGESAKKIA